MIITLILLFFLIAIDTFATFMEWAVMYMILYPDIQARLQRELDEVVKSRHVTLDDRQDTPYVEATVQELMRHSPHMHLTNSRYTSGDVTIKGIHIPKHTQVSIV